MKRGSRLLVWWHGCGASVACFPMSKGRGLASVAVAEIRGNFSVGLLWAVAATRIATKIFDTEGLTYVDREA